MQATTKLITIRENASVRDMSKEYWQTVENLIRETVTSLGFEVPSDATKETADSIMADFRAAGFRIRIKDETRSPLDIEKNKRFIYITKEVFGVEKLIKKIDISWR